MSIFASCLSYTLCILASCLAFVATALCIASMPAYVWYPSGAHEAAASVTAAANSPRARSSSTSARRSRMLSSICTLTKPSAHPCCESVRRPSGLRPVSTGRALTVNAGRSKSPAFSLRNRHRLNTSFRARSIAARRRPAPLASSASSAPKPRSQSPSPICALVSAPSGSRRPCTSTCNDPRCRLASNLVHGDLDIQEFAPSSSMQFGSASAGFGARNSLLRVRSDSHHVMDAPPVVLANAHARNVVHPSG
mmetsp:Transcript_8273/g.37685  ORF Transcript_8273/g.37685 Transcript_8273/m.37685 type:complete len:251 (+) Transcript_8273:1798-2550(+)